METESDHITCPSSFIDVILWYVLNFSIFMNSCWDKWQIWRQLVAGNYYLHVHPNIVCCWLDANMSIIWREWSQAENRRRKTLGGQQHPTFRSGRYIICYSYIYFTGASITWKYMLFKIVYRSAHVRNEKYITKFRKHSLTENSDQYETWFFEYFTVDCHGHRIHAILYANNLFGSVKLEIAQVYRWICWGFWFSDLLDFKNLA